MNPNQHLSKYSLFDESFFISPGNPFVFTQRTSFCASSDYITPMDTGVMRFVYNGEIGGENILTNEELKNRLLGTDIGISNTIWPSSRWNYFTILRFDENNVQVARDHLLLASEGIASNISFFELWERGLHRYYANGYYNNPNIAPSPMDFTSTDPVKQALYLPYKNGTKTPVTNIVKTTIAKTGTVGLLEFDVFLPTAYNSQATVNHNNPNEYIHEGDYSFFLRILTKENISSGVPTKAKRVVNKKLEGSWSDVYAMTGTVTSSLGSRGNGANLTHGMAAIRRRGANTFYEIDQYEKRPHDCWWFPMLVHRETL